MALFAVLGFTTASSETLTPWQLSITARCGSLRTREGQASVDGVSRYRSTACLDGARGRGRTSRGAGSYSQEGHRRRRTWLSSFGRCHLACSKLRRPPVNRFLVHLGWPFQRIVVGGVRDEAAIRGVARGSRSKTKCSLQSAFLQTHRFQSFCFLIWMTCTITTNVPIDLLHILFISTANTLDTVSPPVLDRCQVIQLSGYTHTRSYTLRGGSSSPSKSRRTGFQRHMCAASNCHALHARSKSSAFARAHDRRSCTLQGGRVGHVRPLTGPAAFHIATSLAGSVGNLESSCQA